MAAAPGSWPGSDADDWWDSLPVERKRQIHRWITQRATLPTPPPEPVEDTQLALDVEPRR
jgi:hypothetical protein